MRAKTCIEGSNPSVSAKQLRPRKRALLFGGDEHRPCGLCARDEKDRGLQAPVRENPSVSAEIVANGIRALRTVSKLFGACPGCSYSAFRIKQASS